MSKFNKLEANTPATLGAVVEAVTRLSTFSEAQILELVSAGKINDLFPFRPSGPIDLPADTVDESELQEASAIPLSSERRTALVHASMPASSNQSTKPATSPARRTNKKTHSKR